jgi:hypothetical protein
MCRKRAGVYGLAPLADAAPTRSAGVVKEAYLSWQPTSDRVLDIGRVNLRLGAATGYNPTDFFKVAAIRLETSPEPESRRKNRMGSVMLRGQQLAAGGRSRCSFRRALTASATPKILPCPSFRAKLIAWTGGWSPGAIN